MVDYIKEALKEIEPYITRTKPQKVKPKHTPNGKLPTPKTSNEVQEIQNILRTMSIQSTFNHSPKRKEDMTYLQAIRRGHNLPPLQSSDGDIMPNIIDCRPFNKKKQTDMYKRNIKEGSKTNCPKCGYRKPFRYIGLCPECEENDEETNEETNEDDEDRCDLCGKNEATNHSNAYGGVDVCDDCHNKEDFGT